MAFDRLILFIHLFFHRFAVETGGSGACEIKVSLLDGSQTELPEDQSFTVRREVTDAQGSWELLSHTFESRVPFRITVHSVRRATKEQFHGSKEL